MKSLMRKKMNDRRGETIAEVLIALLISTLALMMLAVMISSTVKIVTSSKEKMEKYYAASAKLEVQSKDEKKDNTVKIATAAGETSTDKVQITADVYLFENPEFGESKTVYAYRQP